jgi:hypothetical protein
MIERLARRTDRRGQFSFAAEARRRVPERDDFVLAKSHRGLHLLAREEDALAFPLRVLRSAFGSSVAIDRMPGGKPVAEVRVGLEKRHLPQARAALRRRGANPSEEYVGIHYCVLRFEAPLAALLGLPSELAALTSGKASHEIVLTRHEMKESE